MEDRLAWPFDFFCTEVVGMPRTTGYEELKKGSLNTFKIGRRRYVSYDEGRRYIRAKEKAAAA